MLGGGAFLPIHWGTFSLAMHAWDQPAEVLYAQAPQRGARSSSCRASAKRSSPRTRKSRSHGGAGSTRPSSRRR